MVARSKQDFTDRLNINSAANDWGLASAQMLPMEEFRRLVTDITDSLANISALLDGQMPIKSATDGVLSGSALTQGASSIASTMPLDLPGDSAFNVGGISAVGRASTVSFLDRTRLHNSEPRMFGPVIHETTAGLVSNPFYFNPQDTFTTTAAVAGTSEVFTGTTHQFAIQNLNLGTVLEYRDIQRQAGSTEISGANLTIRRNSHSDPIPVFDYKRDIAGGAGFTLAAGGTTTVVDLTREQLFLQGEMLFITITGDGSTPLNLLGETLTVPTQGNQQVPHVDSYGRLGSIVFVENSLGDPSADGYVPRSTAAGARSWSDPMLLPGTFKRSVRVVATSNVTASGSQTVDGVTLADDDRVLLAGQTDSSDNGIFVVASGAWARADDADTSSKMRSGIFVPVSEGTVDADTLWYLTTNDPITLDTTDLTFREFSGAMTTFNAPQITALSISGLTDPTPPVGTALGGARTITFTVTNQTNIQGNLTFLWDASPIATDVDPGTGTAAVTIPATTTTAGTTHTGTLRGTNTQGATFERSVTFRSGDSHELGYWAVRAANDFATTDISNLTSFDVSQSGTVFDINATIPSQNYIGILLPEDRELVLLTNPNALNPSDDIRGDFTTTTNARVIGSRNFTLYVEQNLSAFQGTLSLRGTTE